MAQKLNHEDREMVRAMARFFTNEQIAEYTGLGIAEIESCFYRYNERPIPKPQEISQLFRTWVEVQLLAFRLSSCTRLLSPRWDYSYEREVTPSTFTRQLIVGQRIMVPIDPNSYPVERLKNWSGVEFTLLRQQEGKYVAESRPVGLLGIQVRVAWRVGGILRAQNWLRGDERPQVWTSPTESSGECLAFARYYED